VQVPLSRQTCNYTATDASGHSLASALLPVSHKTAALQSLLHAVRASGAFAGRSFYTLALQASVPPLGFTSVFLVPEASGEGKAPLATRDRPSQTRQAPHSHSTALKTAVLHPSDLAVCAVEAALAELGSSLDNTPFLEPPARDSGPVVLENGKLRLEFDVATGTLAAVTHKDSGLRAAVQVDLVYWESNRGGGAYLMKPGAQVRVRALHSNADSRRNGVLSGWAYGHVHTCPKKIIAALIVVPWLPPKWAVQLS
jgi:hypothetical protein